MIILKNANISIMYDSEKLSALKMYMANRNMDFDEEVEKSVDALYTKYVPSGVRDYISMKSQEETLATSSKPKPNKKKEVNGDGIQ